MDQALGQLERDGDVANLRFTRRLAHPPEKVWRALTEPEHLARWFPTDIEGERRAGAPLRFPFRGGEGPTLEGRMLAFDPPSLLELRWGDDVLRFEVRPDGEGSVLTFLDTFAPVGRAARDAAGWHVCLDELARLLDGDTSGSDGGRWAAVHPGYVEAFGPEAATTGPPERRPTA